MSDISDICLAKILMIFPKKIPRFWKNGILLECAKHSLNDQNLRFFDLFVALYYLGEVTL